MFTTIVTPENVTQQIRDLTANCTTRDAAQCCMAVASAIQTHPDRGARLMGLAAAFLMAAEASGLPVPDLMGYARNCMNTAEGKRPEFAAVSTYIEKEILHG